MSVWMDEELARAALQHADHCVRELLRERCTVVQERDGCVYLDSGWLFEPTYSAEVQRLHHQALAHAFSRRIARWVAMGEKVVLELDAERREHAP